MQIAKNNPQFMRVFESIMLTLKDPGYLAKLEAANDKSPNAPAFAKAKTAQPKAVPTQPIHAPSMGLGSPSGNRQAKRIVPPVTEEETPQD